MGIVLGENSILKIFFADYFEVPADTLAEHGAFNISLVKDLAALIDPFSSSTATSRYITPLTMESSNIYRF